MTEKVVIVKQKNHKYPKRENRAVAVRRRLDGCPWTVSPPRNEDDAFVRPQPVVERPRYLQEIPSDPVIQNNLGSDMLAWANTTAAEAIEQFPLNLKMNPYKFYAIANINPYFSDCLDASMEAIGFRREQAARTRKEDSTTIMKMQPLYNKQYRELAIQKSSAEATKVGTLIQVVEGKIPDSDIVPKRIVSDN